MKTTVITSNGLYAVTFSASGPAFVNEPVKKAKTIKTTHIDTGGHGYLSVSKADFLLVCTPDQITGCSGHSLTRMYLEEDCDASLFMDTAEAKGIKVEVKSGYNLHHKIRHNYKPELFYWQPIVGEEVEVNGNGWFTINNVTDSKIIVGRYGIPLANPFEWIIKSKIIEDVKAQLTVDAQIN